MPQEPFHTEPASSRYRASGSGLALLAVLGVATLHAAVLLTAWTTTRHPLMEAFTLGSSAPLQSVRINLVTMAPAPPPVAQPEAPPPEPTPQLLAAETGARSVVREETPPPAPIEPVAREPEPRPLPPKREKTVPAKPAVAEPLPTVPSESPEEESRPAQASAPVLSQQLNAGPIEVAAVNCRVPAPVYPRRARRLAMEGEVLVRLTIDENGQVTDASVARSSGHSTLDDSALEAIRQSQCNPHTENGRPFAVRALQPIVFNLQR